MQSEVPVPTNIEPIKNNLPVFRSLRSFAHRYKINEGLLFVFPAVGLYLLYVAWPIISTIQNSFYNWDGVSPNKTYIGLNNYVVLITKDIGFRLSVKNNIIWALVTIIVLSVIGFVIAYLLNQNLSLRNLYRVAFFLPTTASLVVIGFTWEYIYSPQYGPINTLFRAIGLPELAKVWLSDPNLTLYAVIFVALWSSLGFWVVVYLAALQSISEDLFDAASIDGASKFQQMIYISVPLTMTTTRALAILGFIGAVNQFGLVFLLSRGGPYHASEVMAYQIYDLAFITNHTGYACALSVLLLTICAVITIIQLYLLRGNRMRMF